MKALLTDFHTHILPELDDGSASVAESVSMLKIQQEQGVQTVLLTPHFYARQMYPDAFLEKRRQAMERLKNALPAELASMGLILGAEVHYCPGMSRWEQLHELTLGQTNYILIEMPVTRWTDSAYEELEAIYQFQGITPILAHIDRYFLPFQTRKMLDRLTNLPLLLQIDCSFLTKPRTRRQALKLLDAQKVHLFGSDCHNISTRVPCMAEARDVLLKYAAPETISYLSYVEKSILGK